MAMDLGISDFVSLTNQLRTAESYIEQIDVSSVAGSGWSEQRAIELVKLLNANKTGPAQGTPTDNNQRAATQQFLSIYWATVSDLKVRDPITDAQTGEWVIKNGDTEADKRKIQDALFRGANASGAVDSSISLIKQVYIGAPTTKRNNQTVLANRYPQINAVLGALGITSSAIIPHENHFHIALRPPAPVDIEGGKNLLLATGNYSLNPLASPSGFVGNIDDRTAVEVLAKKPKIKNAAVVNLCQKWGTAPAVEPIGDALAFYFVEQPGEDEASNRRYFAEYARLYDGATVELIEPPLYGTYFMGRQDPHDSATKFVPAQGPSNLYVYVPPTPDYTGEDRWSFRVTLKDGRQVIVRYQMSPGDQSIGDGCKATLLGYASSLDDENLNGVSWQQTSPLSTLLSSAQSAFTGFTDLPGTAVAQTTGTGAYGQITLDTTAAGYTWYLDPTPLDNSKDYLPTADPNIWKAIPGSAADGKMDLLSVLLHE